MKRRPCETCQHGTRDGRCATGLDPDREHECYFYRERERPAPPPPSDWRKEDDREDGR